MAEQDNRLLLLSRRSSMLQEIARELKPHPLGHWLAPCDVSDPEQVAAVCKDLALSGKVPEVLILNSGVAGGFNATQIDVMAMRRQFEINFWGVVYLLQHLLPPLLAQGHGMVAVTGSLAGYRGMPGSAGYSASKAALARLVESLRIDLYRSGVQFSLISPGFVKTPMTDVNDYYMPFLMPVEKAGRIIIRGLERGKTEIHFPYRLSLIAKAAQFIPNRWYAKIMSSHRKVHAGNN